VSDPNRPPDAVDIVNANGDVIGFSIPKAAPDLSGRVQLTRYEFRSRFTTPEKVAMYDSTDTIIKIFLDDIQAAEYIDVTDQATIDGVAYLEAQGLITAGRSVDILESIPR
jgi:hypothetical protein